MKILHLEIFKSIILITFLFSGSLHSQISNDAVMLTLREQTSVWLDSAFAIKIDSALKVIGNDIDTLKQIHVFMDYQMNSLILKTSAGWSENWYKGSLLTGEQTIDSLNNYYNLTKVDTLVFHDHIFVLYYAQPLNIKALADIFRKIPDIIFTEPNIIIGDGNNIQLVKDSVLNFVFSTGSGDCPAGCIHRYFWYVSVNPNNLSLPVRLEEQRPSDYTVPVIYRWNIPARYPMTMFNNAALIFDSIKYSRTWWVRRHAVEGLGLFFKHTYSLYGEDNIEHWNELKNQVDSLKNEAISVLQTAKNDPDSDVRTSAEAAIQIITDVKDKPGKMNGYYLSQNFPNPFNPSTTINFIIPAQGRVILNVYDVLGREAVTLINEDMSAGSHSIKFNAGLLSAGVYFYQLKSGNFISTKKLILLK